MTTPTTLPDIAPMQDLVTRDGTVLSVRPADAEDAWKRAMAWFHRFGVIPAG